MNCKTDGNPLSLLRDNMLQEKNVPSQHVSNPCCSKTCDPQTKDNLKTMIKPRMPVEVIFEDGTEEFQPGKQDGVQSGSLLVGSISPSIISAIDKHIMDTISSKYMNFESTRPDNKQQKEGINSSLPELTRSLESTALGRNGNQSTSTKDVATKKSTKIEVTDGPVDSDSIKKEGKKKDPKEDKKDVSCKALPTKDAPSKATTSVVKDTKEKEAAVQNQQDDDEVVWICFICAKGFRNQDDLMTHQDLCEEEGTQENDADNGSKSTNTAGLPAPTPSVGRQKTASVKSEQINGSANPKPVPALLRKVRSDLNGLPLELASLSRIFPTRKRKRNREIYIPPPRDTYFESLGLVPTRKVEEIKTPQKSVNPDCQIIDLTLEEELSPQPQPMTPRTHLIMSQLSREETAAGRRRQLSFSAMTPPKVVKKVESDTESSDSSVEERVSRRNVPCKSVILAIPLTSLLGQRLKKHWQSDNKIPVISNVELYCQTSNAIYYSDVSELPKKNKFTEKLRNRPPPQVTFKFTKKYINKWFHKFKFNRLDKWEFQRTLATGLEIESRRLLKKMKDCKVSLERMSEKDIKLRIQRASKPPQYMSNLQLMRRNYNNQIRMSLLQSMPRSMRPPLQLLRSSRIYNTQFTPRHAVFAQPGPIPQYLVRNSPNGAMYVNMEALPVVNRLYHQSSGMTVPSNTPKQPFPDDNTVICLSSDDDDEVETGPAPCGRCKLPKEACTCQCRTRPKIGPASFMKHQQSLQQRAQVLRKSVPLNQNLSPVSMVVNTGKVDSASSRVFGRHSVKDDLDPKTHSSVGSHSSAGLIQGTMHNGEASHSGQVSGSVTSVCSSPTQKSGPTHVQIINGKVVHHVTESSHPSGSPMTTSFVQEPGSPLNTGNSASLSDSEYMDYEVICIDSDDDS